MAKRSGAAALALSLTITDGAAASCASPQELAALRAAALRQQLMVAGLSCREAGYFNRFITTYGGEYEESDRALMQFFVRQGSGEDGYNAFKTREANDYSLKSAEDPRFCGGAYTEFYIALHRNLPLAQLATAEAPYLSRIGYVGCMRSSEATDASVVLPALPARRQEVGTDAAVRNNQPTALAAAPAPGSAPVQAPSNDARLADAQSTSDGGVHMQPYPYAQDANRWDPYAPPAMRQVQGADGRWYLVPYDAR